MGDSLLLFEGKNQESPLPLWFDANAAQLEMQRHKLGQCISEQGSGYADAEPVTAGWLGTAYSSTTMGKELPGELGSGE